MNRAILLLGLVWLAAPSADAWDTEADRYVASLNDYERQRALGLREARRGERAVNRLEVTFEDELAPAARHTILQRLGREFLRVLLREQRIPVVVVIERNAAGRVIGSVTVSVSGRAVVSPDTVPAVTRDPC